MNNILTIEKIDSVIDIACLAGSAIMDVYNSEFNYEIKDDNSPVTKADEISHNIITESLRRITPEIPILSEESSNISFKERSNWRTYWLVDPLDGTKEFINKNGEFTVNISLISNHKPTFGLITVPISGEIYWGQEGKGSYYIGPIDGEKKIHVSNRNIQPFSKLL